jgi:hypothetical protein
MSDSAIRIGTGSLPADAAAIPRAPKTSTKLVQKGGGVFNSSHALAHARSSRASRLRVNSCQFVCQPRKRIKPNKNEWISKGGGPFPLTPSPKTGKNRTKTGNEIATVLKQLLGKIFLDYTKWDKTERFSISFHFQPRCTRYLRRCESQSFDFRRRALPAHSLSLGERVRVRDRPVPSYVRVAS